MWYKIEYYSAVKKKKKLIWVHAITWVNLKNLTLSERSQTHKKTHYTILSI